MEKISVKVARPNERGMEVNGVISIFLSKFRNARKLEGNMEKAAGYNSISNGNSLTAARLEINNC